MTSPKPSPNRSVPNNLTLQIAGNSASRGIRTATHRDPFPHGSFEKARSSQPPPIRRNPHQENNTLPVKSNASVRHYLVGCKMDVAHTQKCRNDATGTAHAGSAAQRTATCTAYSRKAQRILPRHVHCDLQDLTTYYSALSDIMLYCTLQPKAAH